MAHRCPESTVLTAVLGKRGRRWLSRLPAVPLAWAVALFVWGARRVGRYSALRLARCLATGWTLRWIKLAPADAVAIVHRLVPGTRGPGRCLFRSLVRFGLLRRAGTGPAVLCLGVQSPEAADQFAHAWVEVDGVPVGEATDPRDTHRLLVCVDGTGAAPIGSPSL